MLEDCGILVINGDLKVQAANSMAEFMLRRSLAPGAAVKSDGPMASSFSRAGRPLAELVADEQENHGLLKGEPLPEAGLWFTSFPVHDDGNRVVGAVITLEKRVEDPMNHALRFLGLSHQDLIDRLPEGVFMVNTRWQISYFNEAAQRITGFGRREALGKFCWEVFRSDLCHKNCPMRVSMSTGENLLSREVEIISRTGGRKAIVVNTAQVKKEAGGDKVLGGLETFYECTVLEAPAEKAGRKIFADIVAVSAVMQQIINRLPIIALSDSNVLIQGESGTGKELVARGLHHYSSRPKGPFVAVNCSAIPETLLESELFGYERGAFTGAVASKPGRFELARGGTLFIDEIGELKPQLQVKLLRVLEDRAFERLGGTRKIALEARIIAATNVELKEAMRQGRFREDLYYRLFTVPVHLPPLRQRREDIPILVKHFLELFNRKFNRQVRGVDPKVMKIFCRHPWPGNVRELQHVLEYCFVFARGPIIAERHLPSLNDDSLVDANLEWDGEEAPLQALEKKTILRALETAGGNKREAASLLKIGRSTLWRKMKAYDITEADFRSGRGEQF